MQIQEDLINEDDNIDIKSNIKIEMISELIYSEYSEKDNLLS